MKFGLCDIPCSILYVGSERVEGDISLYVCDTAMQCAQELFTAAC